MPEIPCMIDFQASSLSPDSYPIEVAWSDASGAVESHYIAPSPGWTDWDLGSEDIHWISREILFELGKPVEWVA